jgi:hypothetical protein
VREDLDGQKYRYNIPLAHNGGDKVLRHVTVLDTWE